jgi:gliding motility-associated-like protein
MRLSFLIGILQVLIITANLHAAAQGSLGDPIYTFDFGSGPNPGPPLASNYTNMAYTSGCPVDGQYTIATNLNNGGTLNCYPSWQNLATDHTGNPNGYMMIINASFTPSIFFTASLPANVSLCQNTTYRFSAYIVNLIKQSSSAGTINPDITFTVNAPDGTLLGSQDTGPIYPNDPSKSPWQQFGVNFNTKGYSTVIVTMTNNATGGDGNDLALDDISFSAYGPALSTPVFNVGSGQQALCQGNSATYNLSAYPPQNAFADPAEQWQQNINGTGWVDLPNQTKTTLSIVKEFAPANTPGTFEFRMAFAGAANINSPDCRTYTPPVTITVHPLVAAIISPASQSECQGDVLTLTASGGTSYSWSGPNMHPTNQNPLIIRDVTAANAGIYTVIASSQYGCTSAPATTKVIVFPKVRAAVHGGGTICIGSSLTLSASGGVSYLWSPGNSLSDSTSAKPVASPTDTTIYKVIITDANGCRDSANVTVNVLKKAVVSAGPDKVIFEGQSVKLSATAKYISVVYWTPATGLSDPNILNPIASPISDITYTLHASSANGCSTDTSSVFIRVYKHITIPNTFSPNNDGINDFWAIDALITYPESIMLVYNRYGQQLFKSVGYSKPWDGKFNGKPLPSGTYYYVLDLKNNTPKIAGSVTIIR